MTKLLFAVIFITWSTSGVLHAAENLALNLPFSAGNQSSTSNIVTVAKSNGDFDDVIDALASISDAGAAKPYVLAIAPGTYSLSQQIVMKPHVSIVGSGVNLTRLIASTGSETSSSGGALLVGANFSSVQNLSMRNNSNGSAFAAGIYNDGASSKLKNIKLIVFGTGLRIGIVNLNTAASISKLELTMSGEGILAGINNSNADLYIADSSVGLTSNSGAVVGIANSGSSSTRLSKTSVKVISNGTSIGASNGTPMTSSFNISRSHIFSAGDAVQASTGTGANETYISDSTVLGTITGDPKCDFVFLFDGTALDASCS